MADRLRRSNVRAVDGATCRQRDSTRRYVHALAVPAHSEETCGKRPQYVCSGAAFSGYVHPFMLGGMSIQEGRGIMRVHEATAVHPTASWGTMPSVQTFTFAAGGSILLSMSMLL